MTQRFPCQCCGFLTLPEPSPGTFFICPVCWWEDEYLQDRVDWILGPNPVSLWEARKNFLAFGASDRRRSPHVRPPTDDERP